MWKDRTFSNLFSFAVWIVKPKELTSNTNDCPHGSLLLRLLLSLVGEKEFCEFTFIYFWQQTGLAWLVDFVRLFWTLFVKWRVKVEFLLEAEEERGRWGKRRQLIFGRVTIQFRNEIREKFRGDKTHQQQLFPADEGVGGKAIKLIAPLIISGTCNATTKHLAALHTIYIVNCNNFSWPPASQLFQPISYKPCIFGPLLPKEKS